MKPPKNPLAGTRPGEQGRKKPRRGLFVPTLRLRRTPGERTRHVSDPADASLRTLGVPIYDNQARVGELGSYLRRGSR